MRNKLNKRTIYLSVLFYLLLFFKASIIAWAQNPAGTIVVDSIYSKNLENKFGENPTREVSVYLPPGYQDSDQRYPVIYFLHGFLADNKMLEDMAGILDYALNARKIRPFIMVIPDEKTTYDGSFYSNAGERFTIQCSMFSQRLENAGVKHFAEEYIGTHLNNIYTKEGRIPNQMLPFFDSYLNFNK